MAIAPLSVTLDRERVVDFSKPFLSIDLSPAKKNIIQQTSSIFGFLNPLSKEIWVSETKYELYLYLPKKIITSYDFLNYF